MCIDLINNIKDLLPKMGNDCQNTHQKHGVEQSSSFLFVLLERYCMLGWRWFDSKRPQDLPCYRHHKEELCHCWNNNTDCITRLLIDRPVINAMNYSQIICKKHDTKVPYGKASHNQVYSKTREKLVRAKREEHLMSRTIANNMVICTPNFWAPSASENKRISFRKVPCTALLSM